MTKHLKKSESLNLFPDKLFYKIGDVSRILEVESYVLRYWESEFAFLRPKRSQSGQRIYTKQDVDLLLTIKRLLYDEKYTINGVRRKFERSDSLLNETSTGEQEMIDGAVESGLSFQNGTQELLNHIKSRLRDIAGSL
jgi:DNA-binding transcriptional MerR regulator